MTQPRRQLVDTTQAQFFHLINRCVRRSWLSQVKGVGSSYWRVVGSLEELIEKAKELKQRTLFGIGFARLLKNI